MLIGLYLWLFTTNHPFFVPSLRRTPEQLTGNLCCWLRKTLRHAVLQSYISGLKRHPPYPPLSFALSVNRAAVPGAAINKADIIFYGCDWLQREHEPIELLRRCSIQRRQLLVGMSPEDGLLAADGQNTSYISFEIHCLLPVGAHLHERRPNASRCGKSNKSNRF